jgi:hypothetical protein
MGIPAIRTPSSASFVFEDGSTSENCDRTCEPVTDPARWSQIRQPTTTDTRTQAESISSGA